MKTILKMILIATSIILIGCGGDGNASFDGKSNGLVVGKAIPVEPGDKLITDKNTVINVIHEVDSTTKLVTLISGTATLIRGNYDIVD